MNSRNLILCLTIFILSGCQSQSDNHESSDSIFGEGLLIEEAWVRPGAEGQTSAAYFLITNFDTESDTLTSVTSEIAQLTEVHESYSGGDSMMSMRMISELEIPGQSTVSFQPGGFHVMFMQLNQDLVENDDVELILHFRRQGDVTIQAPVQNP